MTAKSNDLHPRWDADLTDVRRQRDLILSILSDFLEEDTIDELGGWLDHVGFDIGAIRYPSDLLAAWIAHYRRGRGYDVERAMNNLVTWPPIAQRIAQFSKTGQRGTRKKALPQNLPVDLGKLTDDL